MNEKTAKTIRILTLPPVLLLVALLLLKNQYPPGHWGIAVTLLCVLPLLSYPVWRTIPKYYEGGRSVQRKMAVIFFVSGYILGFLYCLITRGSGTELFVYLCYLISGGLIALSSFCFNLKSSGHAAGVTGPVMILAFRLSPWYLLGLLLMIPVWKSSVALGRHSERELILGGSYSIITGIILALLIS